MPRKNRTHRPPEKPPLPGVRAARPRRYRLLARLSISIALAESRTFRLQSGAYPEFTVRPIHEANDDRISVGGSFAAVEFVEQSETDLLRVLARGMNVLRDALAAISVASDAPISDVKPVQLLETTPGTIASKFVFIVSISGQSWRPISDKHLEDARTLIAHWEEPDLARLRRAAYLYSAAIVRVDPVEVFQLAWLGLEALEPLLAREAGRDSGSETIVTNCKNCGFESSYKRTVLGAVRGFINGEFHGRASDGAEWKRLDGVRNELVHSKIDLPQLRGHAGDEMTAVLHHLRNAIAHLSHAHHLESGRYEFPTPDDDFFVMLGDRVGEPHVPLPDWGPLIEVAAIRYEGSVGRMTPEFMVTDERGKTPLGTFFTLSRPLAEATEKDLVECVRKEWRE